MTDFNKILAAFTEAEEISLISSGEIKKRANKIINLLDDLIPENIFQNCTYSIKRGDKKE